MYSQTGQELEDLVCNVLHGVYALCQSFVCPIVNVVNVQKPLQVALVVTFRVHAYHVPLHSPQNLIRRGKLNGGSIAVR